MLFALEGLPFIKNYITALNESMNKVRPGAVLSNVQCVWLRFVLMGLIVTNSLCWERFERFGLGEYRAPALCWMFRRAKIAWEIILQASVVYIIESYGT